LINRRLLLDVLYVIALGVYIVAGVPLTPFHGDEPMQVYMSGDYFTGVIDGRWSELVTAPPYEIDSAAHLRLINGTVNRYAIGAAWQIAGYTPNDLPPRPGWDWGLSYQQNVETGHRPSDGALEAARLPSALFTALSVGVIFLLVRQMSGRPAAYVAAAVYALNPALLVNGRRALQEGSMLFFGVLTVSIAAWMSLRERIPLWAWGALIISAVLTLASKHSAVVFIAAAWLWLAVASVFPPARKPSWFDWSKLFVPPSTPRPPSPTQAGRRDLGVRGTDANDQSSSAQPLPHQNTSNTRRILERLAVLILSAVIVVAGFVALSPALWNDPPARVVNLLEERSKLLDIQTSIDPLAPMSLTERIAALVVQPASAPTMFYELASWAEIEPIRAEIELYTASILAGYGQGIGVVVTIAAGAGLIVALWRWRWYSGVILWFGISAGSLLLNPLPWQRYYLPLIPVLAVLVGVLIGDINRKERRGKMQ